MIVLTVYYRLLKDSKKDTKMEKKKWEGEGQEDQDQDQDGWCVNRHEGVECEKPRRTRAEQQGS